MHKRIFTKYNHATILLFLLMHLKFVLFSSFREMERKFLRSPCFYHSFFSLVFKGSKSLSIHTSTYIIFGGVGIIWVWAKGSKSLSAYSYTAIYYVWWGGNYLSTSKWGYKILVLYELMFICMNIGAFSQKCWILTWSQNWVIAVII